MHVLMIVDDYMRCDSIGGGDIVTRNLRYQLEVRGHSISVACCEGGHRPVERVSRSYPIFAPRHIWKNLSVRRLWWNVLSEKWRFDSLVNRLCPDVLFCLHQAGLTIPSVAYINSCGIPKLYRFGFEWPRLYYKPERCAWHTMKSEYEKNSEIHIANIISNYAPKLLLPTPYKSLEVQYAYSNSYDLRNRVSLCLRDNIKHRVIYNGVDTDKFQYASQSERSQKQIKLLYVGRLVPHKGIHVLLRALKIIRKMSHDTPPPTLTVVGSSNDSKYIEQIHSIIEEEKINNNVFLEGAIKHNKINDYYSSHNVLVFPSVSRSSDITVEGCPTVLLEAMSSGIPVVARISSGTEEIAIDGYNCLGYFRDDPNLLALAVIKLLANRNLRELLCSNAIGTIRERFTSVGAIAQIEELLILAAESK